MKKIIKIGDKEYTMQSSAYTQFKYKNDTGRKLMNDISSIQELRNTNKNDLLEALDDFLEIILKIAYTMIDEADSKQVNSFEDFLKNIDSLFDDETWITEVIELAVTPISRGNKTNPQQ